MSSRDKETVSGREKHKMLSRRISRPTQSLERVFLVVLRVRTSGKAALRSVKERE